MITLLRSAHRFFLVLLLALLPAYSYTHTPIIGSHEIRDLELTRSNSDNYAGILEIFNTTQLMAGKNALETLVTHPITDVTELKKRQHILAQLIHPEFHAKLTSLRMHLAHIADAQEALTYFAHRQEDPTVKPVIEKFYFHYGFLKKFNDSPRALDTRNIVKHVSLLSPVLEHLVLHFALSYLQEKMGGHDHEHHHHHHDHEHGHHCIHDLQPSHDSSLVTRGLIAGLKAGHLALHAMSIKEMIDQMYVEVDVANALYKKIAAVNNALHHVNALSDVVRSVGLQESFPMLALDNDELAAFAHDASFDQERTLGITSALGSTLYAYRLLQKHADALARIHHDVATLDALIAIAEWMTRAHKAGAPVCFVTFTEHAHPFMQATDFWNIAISPEKAILNSLSLDDKNPRTLIITGPNKAGKSTAIKAVALNAILAQTVGIAAARSLNLAPFHKIISNIIVVDNTRAGNSMFAAELLRAQECLSTIVALNKHEHALVIIDDGLFKGTTVEKGHATAYQFVKDIADTNACITLVATHIPLLTTLEVLDATRYKNYQVRVNIHNKRSTYCLSEGKANPEEVFALIEADNTSNAPGV